MSHFDRLGEEAGVSAWWPVHSAGLDAVPGMPLLDTMTNALIRSGYTPFEHASCALTPDMVEGAYLIVTMTEEHRRRINRMSPDAVSRTFTLKEMDRLMSFPGWESSAMTDPVSRLHALRPLAPRGGGPEDVVDPALGSARLARAVFQELIVLVGRVAPQLVRATRT